MKCKNCGFELEDEQYSQLQARQMKMKVLVWKQRLEDLKKGIPVYEGEPLK